MKVNSKIRVLKQIPLSLALEKKTKGEFANVPFEKSCRILRELEL